MTPITMNAMICISVNDDFVADLRHGVERFEVFVAEPYASVRNGPAELSGLLRAVQRVTVAQIETVAAEDFCEVSLLHVDWRDDDRVAGDDHRSGGQLTIDAVQCFDDRVTFDAERTCLRMRVRIA